MKRNFYFLFKTLEHTPAPYYFLPPPLLILLSDLFQLFSCPFDEAFVEYLHDGG